MLLVNRKMAVQYQIMPPAKVKFCPQGTSISRDALLDLGFPCHKVFFLCVKLFHGDSLWAHFLNRNEFLFVFSG